MSGNEIWGKRFTALLTAYFRRSLAVTSQRLWQPSLPISPHYRQKLLVVTRHDLSTVSIRAFSIPPRKNDSSGETPQLLSVVTTRSSAGVSRAVTMTVRVTRLAAVYFPILVECSKQIELTYDGDLVERAKAQR